jgi:hypothetical protein
MLSATRRCACSGVELGCALVGGEEPGGYSGGGNAGASQAGSSSCCEGLGSGFGCFRLFSRKRSQRTSWSGAPAAAWRNSLSQRSTPSTWSSAPPSPPPRPPFPPDCRGWCGKLGLFLPHRCGCGAHLSFPPPPPLVTAQSTGGRTSAAIASKASRRGTGRAAVVAHWCTGTSVQEQWSHAHRLTACPRMAGQQLNSRIRLGMTRTLLKAK